MTSVTIDAAFDPARVATVLCDLDGVVWLAHRPIEGSVDAVAALRASGREVLFVTNNSAALVADQEDALAALGIDARGAVVTSALAAASIVAAGERVLVCGGAGVREALAARGAIPVDDGPCDAVMVGFHQDFDYARMRIAATAVRAGARLIGTNDDATYPTPEGPIPGGGAILAAVAVAAGVDPTIAGKPHAPMADLIRARCGGADFDGRTVLMVGDRPSTDGRFAERLGCGFAVVRSGVTPAGVMVAPPPVVDAPDLAAVAAAIVAAPREG